MFVSGVSDLIEKECCMAMLENDMNIDFLVIYAQGIEKEKLEERSRETKRYRLDDNSPQGRLDGHGCPRFQQRFSGQSSSKVPPRFYKERVFNPKSQGKGIRSLFPSCSRCGKRHEGKCLASMNGCYGYGEIGHKIRDCLILKARRREGKKTLLGCVKCDRSHEGECLAGSNICFGYGNLGHKIRHCSTVARNEGDSRLRSQPYLSFGLVRFSWFRY